MSMEKLWYVEPWWAEKSTFASAKSKVNCATE